MNIKLLENEVIRHQGKANRITLLSATGGELAVTNQRIVFVAHRFNAGKGTIAIQLDDVLNVDKAFTWTLFCPLFVPNAIKCTTQDGTSYRFTVNKRKKWIEAIRQALNGQAVSSNQINEQPIKTNEADNNQPQAQPVFTQPSTSKDKKPKKPFYKRWWFIGICVFFVMAILSSTMDEEPVESADTQSVEVVETVDANAETVEETTETVEDDMTDSESKEADEAEADGAETLEETDKEEQNVESTNESVESQETPVDSEETEPTQPQTSPKEVDWDTQEMYVTENENVEKASNVMFEMTQQDFDLHEIIDVNLSDVIKAPWKYFGEFIRVEGTLEVIQLYPPNSDIANWVGKGNEVTAMILSNNDDYVTAYYIGDATELSVGDGVTIAGLPCGYIDIDNSMGGSMISLVLISK